MESCQQNDFQTIYQHGQNIAECFRRIFDYLDGKDSLSDWKIPKWLEVYKDKIKSKLLDRDKILQYALFHDCGKPFCLEIDNNGKRHFPNHAQISYQTWLTAGGDEEIANLIHMDMDIHLLKEDGIAEFASRKEAITLLLAGLAEIHGNAKMFGGIDSTSFKIKWKHINSRGNRICALLFGEV